MDMNESIDHGNPFDWDKASADYAKYRDIYPDEFFGKLVDAGLCANGQNVLDLGTGTGVLPRHLYGHGARFVGVDASAGQIAEARRLSAERGMPIEYVLSNAEDAAFHTNQFDVITACQCFPYFDAGRLAPKLRKWLKPGGTLAILYMAWLPGEDSIAAESEKLVLEYNPQWTGRDWQREQPGRPAWTAGTDFFLDKTLAFDLMVPFTRETWNGRIKACRGVGASLPPDKVEAFSADHLRLLERIAPERFTVPHQATMVFLKNLKPPGKLRIRALPRDEVAGVEPLMRRLADYHNKVAKSFSGVYPAAPIERQIDTAIKEVEDGHAVVEALYDGERMIGFGKASEEGGLGSIDLLYIDDAYRGKGCGGVMVDRLLAFLKEKDVRLVDISVVNGNPAKRLYSKHGFKARSETMSIWLKR